MALTPVGSKRRIDATSNRCGGDIPFCDGFRGLSSRSGLGCRLLLLLLLDLLGITVEEHVDHDVPAVRRARDRAAQAEHLARKQPPDEADCVTRLVVRRDRHVDILEGRVRVGESNDGDVDIGRLADRLVVDARVGHDDQARLLEGAGDVVRERAGGETSRDRLRASVGGILEHRAMAIRPCGDHTDVVRVLDSGNNSSSKDELLPCLSNVDEVDACARRLLEREPKV